MQNLNGRIEALELKLGTGDIMELEGGGEFTAYPNAVIYMFEHGRYTPTGEKITGYKHPENKPDFENVLFLITCITAID